MKMELRKATYTDANRIMAIIKDAQMYLQQAGVDQWQNNYPNIEVIKEDIAHDNSYVLVQNGDVVATAAISFDGESTYEKIYEGKWLSDEDYAVIHRVAVANECRGSGIGSGLINTIEAFCINKGIHHIKVDTHEDNQSMQKLLVKNDFIYCGIIYLEDSSKRVAFEKKIMA